MRYSSIKIALACLLLASCTSKEKEYRSVAVTIMIDNTEESSDRSHIITKEGIWGTMRGNDSDVYGVINFTYITDVSLNEQNSVTLSKPQAKANGLQIKSLKKKFLTALDIPHKKYLGPCSNTAQSSIYRPVCNAIKQLALQKSDRKVLIVLSDMVENSATANFYHPPMKKGVIDIEATIAKMEQALVLPDNPGIEVIIVFQPTSTSNVQFEQAITIWSELFARHGISYQVKANL